MSSGEMVDSFRKHANCSKRPVQGVTCLYFSGEEVFNEREEIKEVLLNQNHVYFENMQIKNDDNEKGFKVNATI